MTKGKIAERIKEHERTGKLTTALARLSNSENIEINYDEAKKIANYNNKPMGASWEMSPRLKIF